MQIYFETVVKLSFPGHYFIESFHPQKLNAQKLNVLEKNKGIFLDRLYFTCRKSRAELKSMVDN